ncbi:MAG: hypothetical protein GY949_06340 [Gammaproteobacteria bacterium]|nr:hypothetical protein [Gammaproteobacteria bacterium]
MGTWITGQRTLGKAKRLKAKLVSLVAKQTKAGKGKLIVRMGTSDAHDIHGNHIDSLRSKQHDLAEVVSSLSRRPGFAASKTGKKLGTQVGEIITIAKKLRLEIYDVGVQGRGFTGAVIEAVVDAYVSTNRSTVEYFNKSTSDLGRASRALDGATSN